MDLKADPGSTSPLVVHSILSPEALLSVVSGAYSIDTPRACELLKPGPNDTYLVTTRTERYVVRVYGKHWRSLAEVLYEMDLLRHLESKGVSVSVPIADRDGNLARAVTMPEGVRQL